MTFLLLALSLNACKTVSNDDQPAPSLDEPVIEEVDEPAVEPSKAEAAAEPVSHATSTTPTTTPTVVKRTDCIFVDPDRKTDADGKVTVTCGDKTVQAKATYLGSGAYEFEIEQDDLEASGS